MGKKSFLDKLIELSYDKTKRKVLAIFILGFILRLVAARNLGVHADDANHSIVPIGIFGSGKLVNWSQSTALWYYIQGFFYKIFGPSTLGSRFATVLFGSLLILLMYLFVKKVFKSEKAALISSFLVAISPMLIKNTLAEMDVAVGFFLIFGAYFLFGFIESGSKKDLIFSALFIGVGVMIKLYVLFFAFSFLIFLIYHGFKTKKDTRKIVKNVLLFGVIISILVIPSLAHNYLLYQDKGHLDYIYTNVLGLGKEKATEIYGWAAGWGIPTDFKGFFFGNQINFDPTPVPGALFFLFRLFKVWPLLFIFGVLGLFLTYKRNREYFWFCIIVIIPAFIYLGSQIPMAKHFVWVFVLAASVGGLVGEKILEKFSKIKLGHLLILFLIFSLIYLGMSDNFGTAHFYGRSSLGQVIDYKEREISNNALVVVDSRIYRGTIHWAFAETNYIEAAQFFNLAQELNAQGNLQNIEVYYFECVVDDCGWGTVKNQPEFNSSMEQITEFFANLSYMEKDFASPSKTEYYFPFTGNKEVRYRVYKVDLLLNPVILQAVKKTHVWWLYPAGYDRSIAPIFDDYKVVGPIDTLISQLAWFIHYFELVFSFFAIFYIVHLFVGDNKLIGGPVKKQDETINYNSGIQ